MPFTVEETTVNLVVNEEAPTNIVVSEDGPVNVVVSGVGVQGPQGEIGPQGGVSWTVVTTNTVTESANGYIANSATQIIFTLPSSPTAGDVVRVAGIGAGGWRVVYPAGNFVIFGPKQTTLSTGYLESTHSRDAIEFLCIEANTWQVVSSVGNIEVV